MKTFKIIFILGFFVLSGLFMVRQALAYCCECGWLTCCGYDCGSSQEPSDPGTSGDCIGCEGGGLDSIRWVPFFRTSSYLDSGAGFFNTWTTDLKCPASGVPTPNGQVGLVRFNAAVTHNEDDATYECQDDDTNQLVENVDPNSCSQTNYSTGSFVDFHCWDYASLVNEPTGWMTAKLITLTGDDALTMSAVATTYSNGGGADGTSPEGYFHWSGHGAQLAQNYYCQGDTIPSDPDNVVQTFPIYDIDHNGTGNPFNWVGSNWRADGNFADVGEACLPGTNDATYSEYFNFTAPEDGYYAFSIIAQSVGWGCSVFDWEGGRVVSWSQPSLQSAIGMDGSTIYNRTDSQDITGAIYLNQGETKALTASIWLKANYATTNARVVVRNCPSQDLTALRKPDEAFVGIADGASISSRPTFFVNSNWANYDFTWKFNTNFNGSSLTRVFNAKAQTEFTMQNRPLGSTDEGAWVDESTFVGHMTGLNVNGVDIRDFRDFSNYFTFTADKTKEYKLHIVGNDTGWSYFTFLTGFSEYRANNSYYWTYYLPLVRSTPVYGTITGKVYLSDSNTCEGTGLPDSTDDWSVTCGKTGESAYSARKDIGRTDSFTCLNSSGTTDMEIDSSYTVTITPSSSYLTTSCPPGATQVMIPRVENGDNPLLLPFYIWPGGEAWFQTDSGDVVSGGQITDKYPAGEYFSLSTNSSQPGVVIANGTTYFGIDGAGSISTADWLAQSTVYPKGISFASLKANAGDPTTDNFKEKFSSKLSDLNGSDNDVYYRIASDVDDNLVLDEVNTITATEKYVVFVDGNVIINQNITVADGGFLAIIASGDITVAKEVTRLDGVYVSSGTFTISAEDTPPDVQFAGNGIFKANSFALMRDLGAEDNAALPAEKFTFRPDLVLNSPQALWQSSQTWQEVAP